MKDITYVTSSPPIVKDVINQHKLLYPELLKGLTPVICSHNDAFGEQVFSHFRKDVIDYIGKYYGHDDESDTDNFIVEHKKFVAIGQTALGDQGYMLIFYSKLSEEQLINYLKSAIDDDGVVIKPGVYSLEKDFMTGWSMKKMQLAKEDFIVLNENYDKKIIKDIKTFFKSKEFYEKNNLTHKRGLLLYSAPGLGKTTLIRKIMNKMKVYSIVVNGTTEISEGMFRYIKTRLKDKPKILIFEDIDGIAAQQRSSLLNFIDGIKDNNNTFFIATTNHPQQLDSAISNRPSRFDTVKEIESPDEKSRSKLLLHYFPKLKGSSLSEAVKTTEGFSGAYFKEIFVFSMLREMSITESIKQLQKQNKQFTEYKSDNDMFG